MPFLGKQPTAGFASIVKDDLTGNGSTTAFTLSKQVANANDIAVFVGNVRQEATDAYTVSGTTLTMSGTVSSGPISMFFTLLEQLRVLLFLLMERLQIQNAITTAKISSSKLTGATLHLVLHVTGSVGNYVLLSFRMNQVLHIKSL